MIFTRSILSTILPLENISNIEIYHALNKIGLEVESFKEVVAPKNVVVGKILECKKHPDATKLNITQVAVGGVDGAYVMHQIVCGATNAREGIYVAVALEGAKLPEVTIKKAVLRGIESCGMLCSTTELGFAKVNDGIVELDSSIGELVIGKELSAYANFNDAVFEISITPNRGDCMNLYGIARDLAVVFELEKKPLQRLKDSENAPGIGRVLQIISQEKHDVSVLFKAIETKGFKTPLKVQLFLAYNEALSGNTLKDALTFGTLFSGVILNAYPQSFCQLEGEKIVLQLKKDAQGLDSIYQGKTKLSTIGVNLQENAKEFADIDMQGFLVLEASYIAPEIIAQKVMDTKVKVDPKLFQRTSRGSHTDLEMGLSVLVDILLKEGGILYADAQGLVEIPLRSPIAVEIVHLEGIIGVKLEKLQVVNILKQLEFKVEMAADENLILVTPPQFRHDIVGFQDIAEEVIRFYGIDNVPSKPLTFVQNHQANATSKIYYFRRNLANKAVSVGFNEAVHFVFCEREKLLEYGFEVVREELDLVNPITQELNTLRSSLLLGLLKAVMHNTNNGVSAISFFEIGAVYNQQREQSTKIAFIQSGLLKEERFPNAKGIKGEFFTFCERIAKIVGEFSLESTTSAIKLFHSKQCAKMLKNGKEIGVIATLHPLVAQEFDLAETFLCEIDMECLEENIPQVAMYSKFQKTQRDLSIVLDKEIPYFKLKECIANLKIPEIIAFYPLDVYYDAKLGDQFSLTIRFVLQSESKTLEEKDIVLIIDSVLEALKKEFMVELR